MMKSSGGIVNPESYVGGKIAFNAPSSVTVGATSTSVLAENLSRKYLCLCNDSNETIYLSLGAAAQMNKGIRLNANGGVVEWFGPNVHLVSIYGICASGSKVLTIMEG